MARESHAHVKQVRAADGEWNQMVGETGPWVGRVVDGQWRMGSATGYHEGIVLPEI